MSRVQYPLSAILFDKELPQYTFVPAESPDLTQIVTLGAPSLPRELGPLSKVNIFVGENNSGKSRLLRALAGSKLRFIPGPEAFAELNNLIGGAKAKMSELLRGGMFDANGYWAATSNLKQVKEITEDVPFSKTFKEYLSRLQTASGSASEVRQWDGTLASHVKKYGEEQFQKLEALKLPETLSYERVYIPTLRN